MPLSALLVSELVDTSWDSSWLVSWPVPSVASAAVGSRPKISTSDRKLANNRFFICLFLLMICFLPYGTKCPIGAPVPAPPPSAGTAPRGLAVSSRRRRGSRCLHRCGCRPPPATHGRGHTATIFAACCRRSRFVASAVRFLMDATAGAGRSGHAPGSSRIRMCAKFITTLRRRTHQGADSPAISALRASSALSRGRAPVRYSSASFYSRSSAASDGVCSNARISRVLCQSFRWCRSDRYAQSN